jgi:hypothetical protein
MSAYDMILHLFIITTIHVNNTVFAHQKYEKLIGKTLNFSFVSFVAPFSLPEHWQVV